ncbi:MAG: hypothetical protein AAF675_06855 [Pseudomonadota bacterium]
MTIRNTAALAAAFVAALSLAPAAEARDGRSSLNDFKSWSAEARAAGGYPNPITALYDAMTGKTMRGLAAERRDQQSSKGARGFTGN